jgi:hypothetical protein
MKALGLSALALALAGSVPAAPPTTRTGPVRKAQELVGRWRTEYTEPGLYRVVIAFKLEGNGTYTADTTLTDLTGTVGTRKVPGEGTWRLDPWSTYYFFDRANGASGMYVLRWIDPNTIQATEVGVPGVARRFIWKRLK